MQKGILILFTLLLSITWVGAVEEISSPDEVVLDFQTSESEKTIKDGEIDDMGITEIEPVDVDNTKTLKEKLNNIYYSEVERIDVKNHMLSEILTKRFSEDAPIKSLHWWGGYNGSWAMNFIEDDSIENEYKFNSLCTGIDGKLKDNNADFRVMFNFSPLSGRNMLRYLPGDVYIGTGKIPHHRIQIGHQRPAVGMEGKSSSFLLPFVSRSQIARNYGTARKMGGRIIGDYSLIEYDFGVYDSDTYFKKYFSGAEFDGWVNLKPLGKTNGKYGELKIGGGIQTGNRDGSYTVSGAYAGYEYKKLFASFEYADANGANGAKMENPNIHSDGFNATIGYRLTPKLQILARYDQFNPNKRVKNNHKRETTLGLNYYIKGQGLKLMLNYVFCQNSTTKDSHRIILGAQILL